jgi:hypothetical protein
MLAGLMGVVFLVAGIVGFTRTGFGDFAGHQQVFLLGFAINPLHNLVNVVIGLLGLLMSAGSGLARTFGWLLLIASGAMFVWGLMITGALTSNPVSNAGNPLNFNAADNWFHLGAAFVGLLIAIMPARKVALVESDEVVETDSDLRDDKMSRAELKREQVRDEEARSDNLQTDEIPAQASEAKSSRWHGWRRHSDTRV